MEEKNPRLEYINKLEDELKKAGLAKRFVESEEGQYVISYVSELISVYTNMLISTRKSQEEYIELRAKIDVLRKIKQVLEVQSNDAVIAKLSADLKLAQE